MLRPGNSKLGIGVYSWSLPAIDTCPGRSEYCSLACYARKGHFSWPSNKASYDRNLELAESAEFVDAIVSQIRHERIHIVRVHVSGDFHRVSYVRKWMAIADKCRQTTFLAYTRSWSVARLQAPLRALAKRRNFHLWLSFDQDMPRPPRWKGTRVCYLSDNDEDFAKADLVFRRRPSTPLKYTPQGSLVCPVEQGIERQVKITCSSCSICFTAPRPQHETLPLSGVR